MIVPFRLPPVRAVRRLLTFLLSFGAGIALAPCSLSAQTAAAADATLSQLVEQNRQLQAQLEAQQKTIDALTSRLNQLDQSSSQQQQELQGLQQRVAAPAPAVGPTVAAVEPSPSASPPMSASSMADQEIRLSGEAGLAWFKSGSAGQFPNSDFRVDEARIFLEAPVWKNVYAVSELDLTTREADDEGVYMGQFYLDFENLSGAWGADDVLNVRAGRFYIPFGEEYQTRTVMDDALISHSLSDLWGFSQGLEIYGHSGPVQYVAAVQDGGVNTLEAFNSDKTVSGRIGYDPLDWLHLSVSAMRTGRVNVVGDQVSALWFAEGFFRAIGPAATTTEFDSSLYEADGIARWLGGDVKAAAGAVRFDDNNSRANDSRHLTYYSVEARQQLWDPLYVAARFSHISAPDGYPLAGQGAIGPLFFGNQFATQLTRFSFDLGYQFGPPLVLKVEYSPEWGRDLTGRDRDNEDLLATEIGVKF
jgi:hypothetical protein